MEQLSPKNIEQLDQAGSHVLALLNRYHDSLPVDVRGSLYAAIDRGAVHFVELRMTPTRGQWSIGVVAVDATRVAMGSVEKPDAQLLQVSIALVDLVRDWKDQLPADQRAQLARLLCVEGSDLYVELQIGPKAAGAWSLGVVGASEFSRLPLAFVPVVGIPATVH